jgi:hypothetical protein
MKEFAMQVERREQSIRNRAQSLNRWMTAVVKRTNAIAMVLADTDGLLLESTADSPTADRLAALTASLSSNPPHTAESDELGFNMTVDEMHVCGLPLLVGVVGSKEASSAALSDAVPGLRRILA